MNKSIEQQAFDRLLSEIEGDKSNFIANSELFINFAKTADYKGRYAVSGLVSESDWYWPAYYEQVVLEARKSRQWEVDLIKKEDAYKLLTRLKVDELKKIANGKAKGKNKKEIVDRLISSLEATELTYLIETTRSMLVDSILNLTPKYEDRCAYFLRRLGHYYFSMRNAEEMRKSYNKMANIDAEFLAGNSEKTPIECMKNHGMKFGISEADFLGKAPCERLNCSCTWIVRVDFSKPITPGGFVSSFRPTTQDSYYPEQENVNELNVAIDNFFKNIMQKLKAFLNKLNQ